MITLIRAKTGRVASDEHPSARDWLVASNLAFVPAIALLCSNGWTLVAIHLTVVAVFSVLYHLDIEGSRFGWWDEFFARAAFLHVGAWALQTGCTGVLVAAVVGVPVWKAAHKCHCDDKGACGHPYNTFGAIMHGFMHVIAASGSASLVLTGTPPTLLPFQSLLSVL